MQFLAQATEVAPVFMINVATIVVAMLATEVHQYKPAATAMEICHWNYRSIIKQSP